MTILLREQPSKKWEPVDSADYTLEKDLQKLLAETPSLISLAEIREDAPPLVYGLREAGLPGSGNTDLLAFNTAGDIAVVECKLAANVEIKRKVIAQVLEYGAYLWGMSYDDLNELVFQRENKNLADLVSEASNDPSWNEEDFRSSLKDNLASGRFILVIAVDEMNDELSRTIRFLNACGNPAFAFTALEMRRYQKGKTEILVPHLFGVQTKNPISGEVRKRWTADRFFEAVNKSFTPPAVSIIHDLYTWSKEKASRVWFGTGGVTGSFTFHFLLDKKTLSVFSVYTNGALAINYGWLAPEIEPGTLHWLYQNLAAISGFKDIPEDFKRWPSVRINEVFLNKLDDLARFKSIIEEFGDRIKQSHGKESS